MKSILFFFVTILLTACSQKNESGFTPQQQRIIDEQVAAVKAEAAVNQPVYPQPVLQAPVKHGFVVLEVEGRYLRDEKTIVSGILELEEDLTEDEKYKLLDVAQSEMLKFEVVNIVSRYLRVYDSYAEASKQREAILNIYNANSVSDDAVDAAEAAAESDEAAAAVDQ